MILIYIDKVTGVVGDFDALAVFDSSDVPEDITENSDSGIAEWVEENAELSLVLYPMIREVNQ